MEELVITPTSRFDYAWHQEFMQAVEQAMAMPQGEVRIDMQSVEYLDSSAIGMLVLLYKRTLRQGLVLSIINAQGFALDLLKSASIEQIYELNP